MSYLLQLQNINKNFYTKTMETQALNDVSLSVEEGDFISIFGPSGCGKSTLLSIIGVLDEFDSGVYLKNGDDLSKSDKKSLASLRGDFFGLVFQSFHLIDDLTVLDNILLPLRYSTKGVKDQEKKALELLKKFNLESRINHTPNQLSGGQQQRVAIARALICEPEVLLVDEATGNLDSENSKIVMELLKELNNEGITILMVTHDAGCSSYSKTQLKMSDGRLIL